MHDDLHLRKLAFFYRWSLQKLEVHDHDQWHRLLNNARVITETWSAVYRFHTPQPSRVLFSSSLVVVVVVVVVIQEIESAIFSSLQSSHFPFVSSAPQTNDAKAKQLHLIALHK